MATDIHNSLLFEGIDQKYIDSFLAALPESVHLKKDQFLFHENDPGDSMFIVKSGKVEVIIHSKEATGKQVVIAKMEAGAVIGEVCVFGEEKRSASVRATENSELLKIDGTKFQQLVKQKDIGALMMCYNVSKMVTQRLIVVNDFIRKLEQIGDKTAVKSELEHYRQRFYHESLFN